MSDIESNLRDTAKELLTDSRVDVVVGYENGSLPRRSRPSLVRDAEQADGLVWNSFCANNLAVYLPRLFERPSDPRKEYNPPKVGIVTKACDMRSLVGLLKEHQVPRENVVIIGMPCPGMVGEDEATEQACLECTQPVVEGADVTIGGEQKEAVGGSYEKVEEFEAKSPEERWRYFVDQISKCIRCHACRQACPNCYCKVCFADQTKPRWIGAGDDISDTIAYHIGRIFHQAGRCVECDACVRACPMGLDLRIFTRKLTKDVEELFGYVPGMTVDELPPLCTFEQDDSEDFITES